MVSGVSSFTEKFLLDIDRLQKRSERAQRQITSGLRLASVSDSPDDVSRLLESRYSLQTVRQTELNLGRVKVETDAAEKAIQDSITLVERARVLGSQGASGHQSEPTRKQIALELQGILERLVSVAGTQVEGRFVFSGDSDQGAPYQVDPDAISGVSSYLGSATTRQILDANGLAFSVGFSADIIFDSADPEENVFLAVAAIKRSLLAVDNPPDPPDPTIPTIEEALHNLSTSLQYLNERLANYGLLQNRVAEASSVAQTLHTSLTRQVANIEEADLAEAAIELTQSKVALDAALTARAHTPRKSLFDYLG